jgi:hypothetical protein
MSGLLNTNSVLMCPHGGTVTATTSNNRVLAAGAPVLRAADTFVITGCPFPPTGTPHPCVTVQWQTTDQRSLMIDKLTLSESSVGVCLAGDQAPQGFVVISSTQQRVSGQ